MDIGLPPGQLPDIPLEGQDTLGMPNIPPPINYWHLHRRNRDERLQSIPPNPDTTQSEQNTGVVNTPNRPIASTNSSSSGQ